MAVDYIGPVHDAALDFEGAEGIDGPPIQGDFRGQNVKLNPRSKSPIEEADEMDNYIVVRRKEPPKLKDRKIEDKKKVDGKNRLLHQFIRRLDKQQGTRQYQDYEARLRRLKQMATIQMMERSLNGDASEEERAKFKGRFFSDIALELAAELFGDPTEQDNALEYLEALENFESENAESEIRQAEKMLKRLEGRTDKRGLTRCKDFQDRVEDLTAQLKFSKLFKHELAAAKEALRHAHGQEIKDGYNLIPKASDLFASLASQGVKTDGECSANMLKDVYRVILGADGFIAIADALRNFFGKKLIKKYLGISIELLGADMKSANPSRSVEFLIAVRESLFKVEVLTQIMEETEKLKGLIDQAFEQFKEKKFGEEEEFETTKDIAKFSRQTFVNNSQLYGILAKFGVEDDEENGDPAIFSITQLMELIRRLPIKFFEAQENRVQILESMQSELDEIILREEQKEEEISSNEVLEQKEAEPIDASQVTNNA